MSADIFTLIKANYNIFTKAEKKVADFIMADPRRVLYMSITDLADACDVGDTSVFRFCRDLKLKGYQDFKVMVAQSLGSDNDTSQITGMVQPEDSTEVMVKKLLSTNVSALNETYDLINIEKIQKTVDWMLESQRIVFFGVGASLITAMDACNKFMRIIPNVTMTMDAHLQTMSAALLSEKDLAVIFSYSGSTKDTIDMARLAKSRNSKVIAITKFAKSPLTEYADLVLLCGSNEGPLQGGSLSAKLSQLFLLDVLYMEYFQRTLDKSKHNKEFTANAISEKLY